MRYLSTLLVALSMVVVLTGCGTAPPHPSDGIPSALLCALATDPPRVVLMDPGTLDVLGEIALESTALQMAVADDVLLTAQCGDPGAGSDDRIGVVDPFSGEVHYERTEALDPEGICFSGDGGLVVHGEVRNGVRQGTHITRQPGGGFSMRPMPLPDSTTLAVADGEGGAYLLEVAIRVDVGREGRSRDRIWHFPVDGGKGSVVSEREGVTGLTGVGDGLAVAHMDNTSTVAGAVLEVVPLGKRAARTASLDGLDHDPSTLLESDGVLFVAGFGWEDLEDPGDTLLAFDSGTLARLYSVSGLPGPCSMTAAAGVAYVACQGSGEVVALETRSGRQVARTRPCKTGFDLVDVEFVQFRQSMESQSAHRDRTR